MTNYTTSPNEEAKLIIQRELESAGQRLSNLSTVQNAENLLLLFTQNIETWLTKYLGDYRTFLDGTEQREKELFYWIGEVKRMMDAVIEYRDSLNIQQDVFIEKAAEAFIEKMEAVTKINYN
jgi:hypothetical protein